MGGEHAFDLADPGNGRWLRYGGSVGAYLDVTVVFRRSRNSTGTASASFLSGQTAIGSTLSAFYA